MKRAAIYVRVSTLDQHVESQLYDLRELAAQRGLEVVQEYEDRGVSGSRARRLGLDALMSDARRKKFSVVLVAAFDAQKRDARERAWRELASRPTNLAAFRPRDEKEAQRGWTDPKAAAAFEARYAGLVTTLFRHLGDGNEAFGHAIDQARSHRRVDLDPHVRRCHRERRAGHVCQPAP